jgi:hypothetical protein
VELLDVDLNPMALASLAPDQMVEQGTVATAEVQHPDATAHHLGDDVEIGAHQP